MPVLTKIDETGAAVGEHDLPAHLVEAEINNGLLHEVVRAELAARRQGTASAKTRAQVRGSGAKPWRQKGTGRARAGSSRIPHWTGGGVAFPPVPRDFAFKVNKKVRAKAFRMALGNLVENEAVRVLGGIEFEVPSTKRAAAVLAASGLTGPYLVVGAPYEVDLLLSFRNLVGVRTLPINEVEVQDYIWARSAVITQAALALLPGVDLPATEDEASAATEAPKADAPAKKPRASTKAKAEAPAEPPAEPQAEAPEAPAEPQAEAPEAPAEPEAAAQPEEEA